MPPQTNSFPQTRRSQVWDLLCQALTTDPVLSRAVDTWQLYRGDEDDLLEPTDEDMPLLRIEPAAGPMRWLDESTHEFTWPIRVTLGVIGTDARQLLDFWGAVEAALFAGNTLLDQLYAFDVIQKTLTTPAVGPRIFGEATGLEGQGVLTIRMRINT